MDLGIAGKRALVIGGSSGLGLACAEALAAEGADLVLFARDKTRLDETCEELRSRFGVTVEPVAGDVTVREHVAGLRATVTESGGLDILVVNSPRPPSPMRDFLDET